MTSFLPHASPSFVSGRLGHQRHLRNRPRTWAKPTPGSLQINLLFTIFAEQAHMQFAVCKLVFLQKTFVLTRRRRSAGAPNDWRRALRCMAATLNFEQATNTGQRPSPIVWRAVRRQQPKAALAVRTKYGGAERDRTADPLLAKQVLSQLSYSPNSIGNSS